METESDPPTPIQSPPRVCEYCRQPCDQNDSQAHVRCRIAHSARIRKKRTQRTPEQKKRESESTKAKRRLSEITKIGLRTVELCDDSVEVSAFSLGEREPCTKCGALLWKHEKKWGSICCNKGKVDPPKFESAPVGTPAHAIEAMWKSNGADGKLLRKFARQLNNAVCLASQCVTEVFPQQVGWSPCVVIQGKLFHRFGPLMPNQGDAPRFAQIYLHDPEHDEEANANIRLGHMRLPAHTTTGDVSKLRNMLMVLQRRLSQCNPYIKDFKMAIELNLEKHEILVIDPNKRPSGEHARRYNAPTGLMEVSVLKGEAVGKRCVTVHLRRERHTAMEHIHETHRSFDPLHFVLLFPRGEDGWNCDIRQSGVRDKQISVREFYAYHLHERLEGQSNVLFHASRLFQEYCCMAFAKIDSQRLDYLRSNDKKMRGESYRELRDQIDATDGIPGARIGRRIILPSTFGGGPRDMHQRYQNAMACVREHGKPDLFITMTCNPKHPDIVAALGDTRVEDRPDVVARVFKGLLDSLMDDIVMKSIFGNVASAIYAIEFQKRGLPHAHILIILESGYKINCVEKIDEVVCAEIPEDPALREIVLKCMIHAQCEADPNASCRKDGSCKFGFPKTYSEHTIYEQYDDYHPNYRRRPPEMGFREVLENRVVENNYVVAYNPYLLKKYNCHINVEVCNSVKACKYLYKYVYKGSDRTMARTQPEGTSKGDITLDEISEYEDLRSIGASEACWRIFGFDLGYQRPHVIALPIHLENDQQVYFQAERASTIAQLGPPPTQLTEWFKFNAENAGDEDLCTYASFPCSFVYSEKKKAWSKRQRFDHLRTLGRIHTIHPNAGELFYLRMLLHHDHCVGATSFEHLRIVEGRSLPTFKAVCLELKLLQDDSEWERVMEEASLTKMCPQIRSIFCALLEWCSPTHPEKLLENHFKSMGEDYCHRSGGAIPDDVLRAMVLIDLQERLLDRNMSLEMYSLRLPSKRLQDAARQVFKNIDVPRLTRFQRETMCDVDAESSLFNENYPKLLDDQKCFVDDVIVAIQKNEPRCFFLDAVGGAGKTFCENLLLSWCRSNELVAIAVATSGIAATLLRNGRTAQGRFQLPITPTPGCTWNVRAHGQPANIFRKTSLIIWDEATMANRLLIEALDNGLRDVTEVDKPFGGKVVVLAGDFRQTLPILKLASRPQIVNATLKKSSLWQQLEVRHLLVNMRLRIRGPCEEAKEYASWLLKLGNGELPYVETDQGVDFVELPKDRCMLADIDGLIDWVFPNLEENYHDSTWITERTILAPHNRHVFEINAQVSKKFPGEEVRCDSADQIQTDSGCPLSEEVNVPREYLNCVTPSGLPPHHLFLKKGMPIILLKNLDPTNGLCNGTRLLLLDILNGYILQAKIASGDHAGKVVFIPRVAMRPKDGEFPFTWERRQFPIAVAFAMSINKAQGQTFSTVGVYLQEPVFTHGQLYVAASRVSHPHSIIFALPNFPTSSLTRNVVYREII